jgi:hypothetical protein
MPLEVLAVRFQGAARESEDVCAPRELLKAQMHPSHSQNSGSAAAALSAMLFV